MKSFDELKKEIRDNRDKNKTAEDDQKINDILDTLKRNRQVSFSEKDFNYPDIVIEDFKNNGYNLQRTSGEGNWVLWLQN